MEIHGLCILNCLITIGDEDANNKLNINNKIILNEVVNITIEDSYKTLINTARIEFTRQITVKTFVKNEYNEREEKLIGDQNSIFSRGKRINIKLCYGADENLKTMFDGYVTTIIPGNPFVVLCEDMGYVLKQTALPAIKTSSEGTKLNEFVPEILKGTGISLHPSTKNMNLTVGQIVYPQNCTAADILNRFRKWGIVSYIRYYNGKPYLAIGRTLFSTNTSESVLRDMPDTPYDIYFNEHVASCNLDIHKLDINLLAIEAIALYPNNTMYKATIRRDPKDLTKFQVVNETKLDKRQLKNSILTESDAQNNLSNLVGTKNNTIDLSGYNICTYHEYNVNRETLIKNAESKFSEISKTGIEGDLTLFGDFNMQSGCKVTLHDDLNPERNGTYIVSEVITTFGVNGYRQKIKIPYKLSD